MGITLPRPALSLGPSGGDDGARNLLARIRKTEARCDFENVPFGTYALVVLHDENMNGKLDTNWLGMPSRRTLDSR